MGGGGVYRFSFNILQKTFSPITCHNLADAAIAAILFVLSIFLFICSTVLFADPTDEEENLVTGVVTVVVTDDDNIAAVHKPGET